MIGHAVKSVTKAFLGALVNGVGIGAHLSRGKVAILAYHRVVTEQDLLEGYVEPGMYVLDTVFRTHIAWLAKHFQILSFADLLARWGADRWDDQRAYCVLTFDDGWLDNYRHAFPVLKAHKVPATIFLPTNFVGARTWFWTEKLAYVLARRNQVNEAERARADRIVADVPGAGRGRADRQIDELIGGCKLLTPVEIEGLVERLGEVLRVPIPPDRLTVNWEEVADMAEGGITFGSHSCSHHLLPHLGEEVVRHELTESAKVLQSRTSAYVPVFCYPNGDNNARIQALVKESGYAAAVGTKPGVEYRRPRNLYELNRVGMHDDISASIPLLSFHLAKAAAGR